MLPISAQALSLLQEAAPDIISQIEEAASRQKTVGKAAPPLRLPFARFEDDFLLLYATLWYATTHNVIVQIVPAPVTAPQE